MGYRHPSEFEGEARRLAYEDQDDCPDPSDPDETVQTTILSRRLPDTH